MLRATIVTASLAKWALSGLLILSTCVSTKNDETQDSWSNCQELIFDYCNSQGIRTYVCCNADRCVGQDVDANGNIVAPKLYCEGDLTSDACQDMVSTLQSMCGE